MPALPGGTLIVAALLASSAVVASVVRASDLPAARMDSFANGEVVTEDVARAGAVSMVGVENPVYSFYFTRGAFSSWSRTWAMDAPAADRWIASVMRRLTLIDVSPRENYVALDDPDLGRFPFLYILEVGGMQMRNSEVEGLRNYLLRGGFVMVDDFWGSSEWSNWEREIRRALPEYDIVELPLSHGIFSTMYNVDEVVQVPAVNNLQRGYERDGVVPRVRGIFDDKGRLMVVINWNTDLGDAWEWAEASYYPVQYSTYAYQVAANTFLYALTH